MEDFIDDIELLEQDEFETEDGGSRFEHRRVVADKGQEPMRVDKFLMEHLPEQDTESGRSRLYLRE